MIFLPIVARELIEASRRRNTYWLRVGVAAVGLAIGGFVMLLTRQGAQPGEIGMYLFVPLAIASFLYTMLVGVFRTADCLSEEKREGTLGLLFLTDLKGYDIVVGKLAATSLNAFYGVLALFPVMAIPLLAGGVAIGDFWRVAMVSLNNLFFSLAIGMFCSSISRDDRRAAVLAFLMLLFFAAGMPLIGSQVCAYANDWTIFSVFLVFSPGFDCFGAFEEVRKSAPAFAHWWLSVLLIHGMSWLLLLLACIIVPRTWQDKAGTPASMRRRERLRSLEHGSSARRRAFRIRLLEKNPFLWLAARERMKVAVVWAFLGTGAVIWCIGLCISPQDWRDPTAYLWTALIAHSVLKIWMATEASKRFSSDCQSGALELLLATPITVKEILRGQWLALQRQFALPMLVVLLADFVFLKAQRHDTMTVCIWVSGMVIFTMDMLTLAWVGMWRGLNSQRTNRAALAAIARILILPWVAWIIASLLFLVILSRNRGSGPPWGGKFLIVLWLALSIAANLLFGLAAFWKLRSQFRTVATTRFEARGRAQT